MNQYIETAGDSRGKLDIEREAKLGLSLGAFYRVCENNGCGIMEGGSIPAHKLCGGCKIVGVASHFPCLSRSDVIRRSIAAPHAREPPGRFIRQYAGN